MSNGYTIALTPAASAPWWLPLLAEGITIALTSLVIVCEMCELQDHRADDVFVRELGSADPKHRELAARAVGELGLSSETARLRTLLHDPEEAVAAEAARSLGLLGDSESAPEIARLADRGDDETREYVANSLARLTHSAAREKLRVLLDDPSVLVRVAAIRAAGNGEDRESLPRLIEMAGRAEGEELATLIEALGAMRDRSALPLLRSLAGSRRDRAAPNRPTYAELAGEALKALADD